MAELDTQAFLWLNHALATGWLDELMLFVSSRLFGFSVAAAAILWSIASRNFRLLTITLTVGVAIGLADLLTFQALKPTFQRLRPCHELTNVRVVQERCGGDFGFPSNHAANSGAMVGVVALLVRDRRVVTVFAAAALIVGVSRSYLGVHYPGDVLAGFFVGGVIGVVTALLARRWLGRFLGNKPSESLPAIAHQ